MKKSLFITFTLGIVMLFSVLNIVEAARTDSKWNERLGSYIEPIWPEGRNILIRGTNKYLNFNTTSGSSGYGIRDNGGTMECKNSGGSWSACQDGSGSGTVTSVDMSVPLGLAISGNPITGAGTLALSLASGYVIPLTASTTDWTTAFNWGDHSTAGYFPLSSWYATTTDGLDEGLTNKYYSDAQVGTYISGSSTVPHVGGSAFGDLLSWTGSAWGTTSTSTLGLPTFTSLADYLSLSAWYATTTHALISSLPSLSITKSQVSDFGTYEAPLSFTYPLSRSVNTVSLSDMATGTVSSGTGISVTAGQSVIGSGLTITNTAPDQTVSLSNGTGISTSGTYPNFTITNTLPYSDDSVNAYIHSSTTIPKTYTNNIFTGLNTFSNATATQLSATDLWVTPLTSALLLTGTDGKLAEYTGTTCTNQFVRALSALGVATCESVSLSADVTGTLADGSLSSNVALLNRNPQTFTGAVNNFLAITASQASTSALSVTGLTGLVYSNGTTKPATVAQADVDYQVPLTFGDGLTRTANDVDCDTASGSVFGCLSSADWTTFNNKWDLASTTIGVPYGGTGSTTLTGILKGNGTGGIQTAVAGTDYVGTTLPKGMFVVGNDSNLVSATSSIYVTSIGRIGMGTSTPFGKLNVAGNTGAPITLTDTGAGANLKHWQLLTTAGDLIFRTFCDAGTGGGCAVGKMWLTNGGLLGIASSTPESLLSIGSDTPTQNLFSISRPDYGRVFNLYDTGGNPTMDLGVTAEATADLNVYGTIDSTAGATFATASGDVGIGTTSPLAELHIWKSAAATSTAGHYSNSPGLLIEGDVLTGHWPVIGLLGTDEGSNAPGSLIDFTVASSSLGLIDRWAVGRDGYQGNFFVSTSTSPNTPMENLTKLFQISGSNGNVIVSNNFTVAGNINSDTGYTISGVPFTALPITWTDLQQFSAGASTSALRLSNVVGVANNCLQADANGDVTGTGSACGGGGGSGNVATSTADVSGQIATFTSDSATPATIGGSTNLFWNNGSGFMGLGTSSPTNRLTLQVGGGDGLRIHNNSGLGEDLFKLVASTTDDAEGILYMNYGPTDTKVKIGANSLSYLDGGSVGIGTTTPAKLFDVDGDFRSGVAGAAANLFVTDTANNRVGIGTGAPEYPLHVVSDSTQLNVTFDNYSGVSTAHSTFFFRRANGTIAIPTSVASGDELWEILGYGYDAGSATFKSGAALTSRVTDNDTSQTGLFADLGFATINGAGRVERMTIQDSGEVGIGDTTPASLLTVGSSDAFQVNNSGQVVAGTWMGTAVGGAYGGTGLTTNTPGSLLVGTLTGGNAWTAYATTSLGGFLKQDYTTGMPVWAATSTLGVNFTDVIGTLGVPKGGTGLTAVTDGKLVMGSTATALTSLATSTGGTVLMTSQTTGRPSWVATSTLFATQHFYPSFTYATSSAWTGTTTIPLGPAYNAETWDGAKCFTDTGTLNVSFYDGTNRMDMFNASTTIGTVTLTTNNTFTASETRYVDVGTPASTPTKISCTVSKLTQTGL